MSNIISLQQLIEKEYFILCPFLSTDRFISYCKDRSINISKQQLEQFEKLGIFTPIARVQLPKVKSKIVYIENGTRYKDLGILEDDEKWEGDIKEEYAHFWFKKNYAENWFEEGILWEPSTRDFQDWGKFYDNDKHEFIISYYSIFQCYTLYNLMQSTKMELRAEWWHTYSEKDIANLVEQISEWAKSRIDSLKAKGATMGTSMILCLLLRIVFDTY